MLHKKRFKANSYCQKNKRKSSGLISLVSFNGSQQIGSGADTCGQADGRQGYWLFSRLCERVQKLTKASNRAVRTAMYRSLNSLQLIYCVLG
jgi:hypothetical protein